MSKKLAKFALTIIVAATSAGCAISNGPEEALTVAERHPISVSSQTVTLTLDLDTTVSDLKSVDKSRVKAFAQSYLASGHGPLTVTAPSGGPTDHDGQETAADIRQFLYENGVDWSQMAGATYRAGDPERRELILSYTHYVATASACGDWTGEIERKYRNLASNNFGCATQNNLAAMVSDPRDLIMPADAAYADSEGRIRVIRAYRAGESTASASEDTDVELSN